MDSNTPRLLLASASPRRRELLALLGVPFTVVTSRFDEARLSHITNATEYVCQAAESKAGEVATRRDGFILGVDTDVVAPDGSILGKPNDATDAARMLRLLSGKTHSVYTGVALMEAFGGSIRRQETALAEARVTFAELTDAAIQYYVATGEPMDKAGAYAIQGGAMAFVTYIEGDLSAIIGLPLTTTTHLLQSFGVPLWNRIPTETNPDA